MSEFQEILQQLPEEERIFYKKERMFSFIRMALIVAVGILIFCLLNGVILVVL